MKPRTQLLTLIASVALLVLVYGMWVGVRARRNLVTLNVRNMDVREVVRKVERQTWESIFVHKDVQGKITMNVRNAALEDVLKIIGEQTFSRWSALYPLYSNGPSLSWLKKSLRGEVEPADHGWTNLQTRSFFAGGPMPGGLMFGGGAGPGGNPFGETAALANPLVSLQIQDKDLSFASLALARFAQTRVVPEDGITTRVSLTCHQATVPAAVSQLAKKAGRHWTKFYALRSERGPGGPGGPEAAPQFAARGPSFGERRGPGRPDWTPEQREELRQQRDSLEEELKQALPAEERQKLDLAQQQREQQFQEMQNLSPEERRARFSQMGRTGMDKMNRERVLNSTPEQRAEMRRRMSQMRRPPGGPAR